MTSSFATLLSNIASDVSRYVDYNYALTSADMNKLLSLVDENGVQVLIKHGYNPTCPNSLNEFWENVIEGDWSGFLTIDDSKERSQFMDFWMDRDDDGIELRDMDIYYEFNVSNDEEQEAA